MNNLRKNSDIGEINRGTARITTRAIDRLSFMDRIILLDLEAYYSEILRPLMYEDELVAYPIYEPLYVTDIYLYTGDVIKLKPISSNLYKINGNCIIFDKSLLDLVEVKDVNQKNPDMSITIRYAYNPVYHVVDANRELMRVRERNCAIKDSVLKDMPINVLARKAHYMFDNLTFGNDIFDNSIKDD
jgi:signal peptidase I